MKLAFFDPSTGIAARIFSGLDADANSVREDPRFAGFEVRDLADTPFADVAALVGLPSLTDFDAAAGG